MVSDASSNRPLVKFFDYGANPGLNVLWLDMIPVTSSWREPFCDAKVSCRVVSCLIIYLCFWEIFFEITDISEPLNCFMKYNRREALFPYQGLELSTPPFLCLGRPCHRWPRIILSCLVFLIYKNNLCLVQTVAQKKFKSGLSLITSKCSRIHSSSWGKIRRSLFQLWTAIWLAVWCVF